MTVRETPQSARSELVTTALLGGIAFAVGGLVRLPLAAVGESDSAVVVLSVLMLSIALQAGVGFSVLSRRFADRYAQRRMWVSGVAAVSLGMLVPVALFGPLYVLFLFIAGVCVGGLLGLLLKIERASLKLTAVCGGGYFLAMVAMLGSLYVLASLAGPVDESGAGALLLASVPVALGDFVIGVTLALGVDWVLRSAPLTAAADAGGVGGSPGSAG